MPKALSKNKCIVVFSVVVVLALIYFFIFVPIQDKKTLEKSRMVLEVWNMGFLNGLLEKIAEDYFSITGEKMAYESIDDGIAISKEKCKELTNNVIPNESIISSIVSFCSFTAMVDISHNHYKNQELQETKMRTDKGKLVNVASAAYTQRMITEACGYVFLENWGLVQDAFDVENVSETDREEIMKEINLRFKDNISAEKNALISLKKKVNRMQFKETEEIEFSAEEPAMPKEPKTFTRGTFKGFRQYFAKAAIEKDIDDLANCVINQDPDNYILYSAEIRTISFMYQLIEADKT